jgi:quercetin dioxygenase-like cupin family protein
MKFESFPDKIKSLQPHKCRFDAFKMDADNCKVFFASYPAGADIEPHQHDTENYGVVTKGEMTLIIEGTAYTYKTGEWYHIPAEAMHSAQCAVPTEQIEFWFETKAA